MKSKIADFPDWFGPMLVKELRQGLKTRGFVFSFVGLQTVLVLVLVYNVLVYARAPKGFDATALGGIFWTLLGGLLIFVTPLRAFNELAAERKANTLELIFLSGLTAWRIAFGKWISLLFQALLFLLAVLPYAILRYYFGAVDLAQDLHGMLIVMLFCAVLSAMALAVSGMPLWVRILTMIGGVFLLMSMLGIVPMLIFGMSRGGSSTMLNWVDDVSWGLIGWDIVLICLISLRVAAATVAPLAENHTGMQRFLALLLWLPLMAMTAMDVSEDAILTQLVLFAVVSGVLAWYQSSVRPSELRTHCRPFRGWRMIFGIPFQPGWPSATVFLMIVVFLVAITIASARAITHERGSWWQAALVMIAASVVFATFVWILFRQKARFPLLFQTLVLLLCGVAVALIMAGKPPTSHLGGQYIFGFLPPMAIWAMADEPAGGSSLLTAVNWCQTAYAAFGAYALILIICGRKYWQHYFRTCLAQPASLPSEP